MKFFSHHIGDFDKATRHLTRIERSIYRDLMDIYYDTEMPLTLDGPALCRKIIARSPEEVAALDLVLVEFFTRTPAGWYHSRCEEELEIYRASTSQKSAAGKASAAARAARLQDALNSSSTGVDTAVQRALDSRSTNHEPSSNNHEPVTTTPEPTTSVKPVGPKSKTATGSRLPEDWRPSQADVEYCRKERPELRLSAVAQNFFDYWIAKPGAAGRKVDWSATWRTWVRKETAPAAARSPPSLRGGQQDLDEIRRKNNDEAKRLLGFASATDDGRTIDAT